MFRNLRPYEYDAVQLFLSHSFGLSDSAAAPLL